MARKLKTYQTSLGFYDLAIAAPSMKAALEAWGAGSNLFHQGVAKETDDPDVVAATLSKPGVVLRRPAGSNGRFAEHADLPAELGAKGKGTSTAMPKKRPSREPGKAAARTAALKFDKEQKRQQAERRRQEAAEAKQRERRDKAIARAQAALDSARQDHEAEARAIEAERAAVERRAESERARWEKQEQQLEAALR